MKNLAKVVFGYKNIASCNFLGNSDGWSFKIYEKGTVRIKKFTFDNQIISSEKFYIPFNVVEKIKKILFENKSLIDNLSSNIDNHSCDGSYDIFNFYGKKITCLNISRSSEEKIMKATLEVDSEFWDSEVPKIIARSENIFSAYRVYFNEKHSELIETIRQENKVLKIFEAVYNILKNYGLTVYSWNTFYCDWKI